MTGLPSSASASARPASSTPASGTVRWSVNLDWADLRLGPLVESRYGVPVVVANDSQAAALAELTFYRRPRPNNLIVIKVGRGIGAGIILNGQLFQGDGSRRRRVRPRLVGRRRTRRAAAAGRAVSRRVTSMRALVDAASAVEPTITDETGLVAAFKAGVAGDPADRPRCRARARAGRRLADRRAQCRPRAAGRAGRGVRRGLAGRGPALGALQRPGAAGRDTQIEFGHVHDDVVVLGASALLMEQQLGLGLAR